MFLSENRIGVAGVGAVVALLAWASLVTQPIAPQLALKRLPLAWVTSTTVVAGGYICYVAPNSSGGVISIHSYGVGPNDPIMVMSTAGTVPICTRGSIKGE